MDVHTSDPRNNSAPKHSKSQPEFPESGMKMLYSDMRSLARLQVIQRSQPEQYLSQMIARTTWIIFGVGTTAVCYSVRPKSWTDFPNRDRKVLGLPFGPTILSHLVVWWYLWFQLSMQPIVCSDFYIQQFLSEVWLATLLYRPDQALTFPYQTPIVHDQTIANPRFRFNELLHGPWYDFRHKFASQSLRIPSEQMKY